MKGFMVKIYSGVLENILYNKTLLKITYKIQSMTKAKILFNFTNCKCILLYTFTHIHNYTCTRTLRK